LTVYAALIYLVILVQIMWALNLNFSSANANPKFEGRGGEELANDIASMLSQAYGDKNTLDMRKLCIADGQHCWILYIDVLVGLKVYTTLHLN